MVGEISLAAEGAKLSTDEVRALEVPARRISRRTWALEFNSSAFTFTNKPRGARQKRQEHALWITANRPDSGIADTPYVALHQRIDGEAFETAAEIWKQHVNQETTPAVILGNAAHFFLIPDRTFAEKLLKRAIEPEPSNLRWTRDLAQLYLLEAQYDALRDDRREAYERALITFERCQPGSDEVDGWISWAVWASKAAIGANELDRAREIALRLVEHPENGNAVHHGNNILGRISLVSGNLDAAKEHLIAAGNTPGSPQLDSFGPNMQLAPSLLEEGETTAVIQYLQLCERFWPQPMLDQWREEILNGGVPTFGANLRY
jgi:hypothetical protein